MTDLDEALFPEICVVCHACNDELPIPSGLTATEAVWMHEPDCRAAAAELEALTA